jgi:hypothetical protein
LGQKDDNGGNLELDCEGLGVPDLRRIFALLQVTTVVTTRD